MKIVALETHIVAVPPPHIGGMYWLFVKLKTDCGIEGVGEIYAATFGPKAMLPIIEDVFERYLLNHDPHHIERFFRQAYSSGFTQRPDLTMMGVVSGLEMACWDIIGKAANKPVYELLGGKVNERLRSYTYLYPVNSKGEYDYDDPDLAAECAIENMNKGFTAVKFDPAGPYTAYSGHQISLEVLERCETFCRKIREAVGDKCDLLFGTHGQMVPSSAIRLAKRLEKATGNTLVVTDGVFSMDGDLADLPALARETRARGAWLMVDDAHGFGPLGANGGGIVEHFGLSQEDVPVLVGTLGKAFGTAGAFVAGSEELIESLIYLESTYIYTTSQPPALACATLKSLELLRTEHWRREHLNGLIRQFRQGAAQIGMEIRASYPPSQPKMIG